MNARKWSVHYFWLRWCMWGLAPSCWYVQLFPNILLPHLRATRRTSLIFEILAFVQGVRGRPGECKKLMPRWKHTGRKISANGIKVEAVIRWSNSEAGFFRFQPEPQESRHRIWPTYYCFHLPTLKLQRIFSGPSSFSYIYFLQLFLLIIIHAISLIPFSFVRNDTEHTHE